MVVKEIMNQELWNGLNIAKMIENGIYIYILYIYYAILCECEDDMYGSICCIPHYG